MRSDPHIPASPGSWISPSEQPAAAAEAIRGLNHLTLAGGYAEPADLDATLAQLAAAVHRLPQALAQAAYWLTRQQAYGRLWHDKSTGSALTPGAEGLVA